MKPEESFDNKPRVLDTGQHDGDYEVKPSEETIPDPKQQYSFKQGFATFVAKHDVISNVFYKTANNALTFYEQLNNAAELKDYDPLAEKTKYDPKYWPILGDSKTPWEVERRILRQQQIEGFDKVIENSSGWSHLLGVGFLAPISPGSWVPILRAMKNPSWVLNYAKEAAVSFPSILAGTAIDQSALYWAQEAKDIYETAKDTVTMSIFGSLIAGGIPLVGKGLSKVYGGAKVFGNKLYKRLIGEMVDGAEIKTTMTPDGKISGVQVSDGGSAGAMKVENIDIPQLEDYQLLGTEHALHPAKAAFWMADAGFKNLAVKGLRSKSIAVVSYTDGLLEHNYETIGAAKKGMVREPSVESQIKRYTMKEGLKYQLDIVDFYYKQLGLEGSSTKNAALSLVESSKAGNMSMKDFMLKANIAITEGGIDHEFPVIAEAAKHTIETILKPTSEQLAGINRVPPNFTPFGAAQYLHRVYAGQNIIANRPQKIQELAGKYGEYNDMITAAKRPLEDLFVAKGRLETLKGTTEQTVEGAKRLNQELKNAKKAIKDEKLKLRDEIIQGKHHAATLVGDRGMSWEQLQELKTLRAPIDAAKKEVKQSQSSLKKIKNDKEARKEAQKLVKQNKEKLKVERDKLNEDVKADKLDKSLFFKTAKGNYRLKKSNYGTQQFRNILDADQLEIAARNTIDNITGLSEQQITESLMETLKSGSIGNPMNPRVLLTEDKWLYEHNWMETDLRKTIPSYLTKMGRLIETDKYFRKKGWDINSGKSKFEFLSSGIAHDFELMGESLEAELAAKLKKAKTPEQVERLENKYKKKRVKLASKQKHDVEVCKTIYSRVTGEVPMDNHGLIRTFRTLNNYAYASNLGLMTLTCLQDAATPFIRMGVVPHIRDSVVPYIRGIVQRKGAIRLRQALRDLNLGFDTELALNELRWGSGLDTEMPAHFAERTTKQAANIMGMANFSNMWTDQMRRITGTGITSNMYRRILKFSEGKLKGNALSQFKVLRMNDLELTKRMVAQYKKHGGEKINGAYEPNLHMWDDGVARDRYEMAIRQELDSVIFSGKNISSYPSVVDFHGLANSFMMYMGWHFTAMSNYILPALQRFDYNKIVGITAAIAIATVQDPFRKISKGQELEEDDLDPWLLAKRGILNSGVLGIAGELFNRTNAAFDIFPELKISRFSDKGKLELLSGAPFSAITFAGHLAGQLANNEWNKNDLKAMKRNFPLVEASFLKYFGNKYIESLDLPQTRHQAHKERLREEGIVEPKKRKRRKTPN